MLRIDGKEKECMTIVGKYEQLGFNGPLFLFFCFSSAINSTEMLVDTFLWLFLAYVRLFVLILTRQMVGLWMKNASDLSNGIDGPETQTKHQASGRCRPSNQNASRCRQTPS